MATNTLTSLIFVSGLGHIVLSLGSIVIPRILNWTENLRTLSPLLRQMFWTYAGYILVINFSFGLISLIGTEELINKSMLAKSITLFIALYWFTRILIQFFYFDRSQAPKGLIYTLGEAALVTLFGAFTIIYSLAFLSNISWI
jgi:hypothetical protein